MNMLLTIIRRSLLSIVMLVSALVVFGVLYIESSLPSVEMLKDMRLSVPLRVYSSDNKLIAEFGEERRTPITIKQVPKELINAILSTEDQRFYQHAGVDFRGLMRAGVHLLTNASMKQGGSTITMQVARNFFLTRKKTFLRKISEILLALRIEKELTKDEILELYLNKIYFGKRAYGVASAAQVYYGTTVDKLTLDQIAMIAGLPQAPSSINPLHNPEAAYKRRKHVLERMYAYDYITKEQYQTALEAPLPTKYHGRTIEVEAPYVAEMVRQDLFARYGEAIYSLGYEVYTTLQSEHQVAANHALKRALLEYDERHGYRKSKIHFKFSKKRTPEEEMTYWLEELQEIPSYGELISGVVTRVEEEKIAVLLQDHRYITIPWEGMSWARPQLQDRRLGHLPRKPADIVKIGDVIYAHTTENGTWRLGQVPEVSGAFVSVHPDTGHILALVGGFDYTLSAFNRVTQAERQPGSNFKPFLYGAALEEGYTLSSILSDAPFSYTDPVTGVTWRPHNDKGRIYGPSRLKVCLARSQNVATVRLVQAIGVKTAIAFAERLGFNRSKLPPYLSLALGAAELTPLDMVAGYSVYASGGYRIPPYFIKTIKDYQGNLIHETPPPEPVQVISPQVAFLITSALQEAIQSGTGQKAKSLGRQDLSGKTGTTNGWMDAWYSGFNRDVVATAWVGFDEVKSIQEYGGVAALPMWMYYMEAVLKGKPENAMLPPPGIISAKIDPNTGLLAKEGQANAIFEYFAEDNLPNSQHVRGYEEENEPYDLNNSEELNENSSAESLF
jgi:penicillin-binding protein 1A